MEVNPRSVIATKPAAQGLAQSKISFRVSLMAAGLGFVVILMGVGLAILRRGIGESIVPVIAGAVVDAVAALFFVQDRRAQTAMIGFFDKLRDDRKLDEALALMRQIGESHLRDRLHVLLALHFSGISDPATLFQQAAGHPPTFAEVARFADHPDADDEDEMDPESDRRDGSAA